MTLDMFQLKLIVVFLAVLSAAEEKISSTEAEATTANPSLDIQETTTEFTRDASGGMS